MYIYIYTCDICKCVNSPPLPPHHDQSIMLTTMGILLNPTNRLLEYMLEINKRLIRLKIYQGLMMLGFSMMSVGKDFYGNLALFSGKSDSSLMDLIRSILNSLCLLVGTINVVSLMINLPFGAWACFIIGFAMVKIT